MILTRAFLDKVTFVFRSGMSAPKRCKSGDRNSLSVRYGLYFWIVITIVMPIVTQTTGIDICGAKLIANAVIISPILSNPPTKAALLTILLQRYVHFIYSSIATWYPDKTWKFFGGYKRSIIGG